MNYYERLNIQPDATQDEVRDAIQNYENQIFEDRVNGQISADEFNSLREELEEIEETLMDDDLREDYDNSLNRRNRNRRNGRSGSTLKKCLAAGAVVAVLTTSALALANKDKIADLFKSTGGEVTVQQESEQEKTALESGKETTAQETAGQEVVEPIDYGDINDEALISERATNLANQLSAMNVINPTTNVAYTVEEIRTLILYANGVYTPTTMEEIDVLHLNLLNLLISPLNTDPYLYHVVYASGNDEFKDMAIESSKAIQPIDFASAFAKYGTNGVYPLTEWIQQKREEIFKATDRETINKIYIEVGQVMADIMKGNGCTITVYNDKQEAETYTYTSEQILANHASAMLLTIEAQLIFANHYEVRDINDNVIDQVQSTWEVYNKFNGEEPDQVTLDEIQAWINNGCDYEWGIDDVLINGQTFGQRIQGDLEGMAQNNYAMASGNTLTK